MVPYVPQAHRTNKPGALVGMIGCTRVGLHVHLGQTWKLVSLLTLEVSSGFGADGIGVNFPIFQQIAVICFCTKEKGGKPPKAKKSEENQNNDNYTEKNKKEKRGNTLQPHLHQSFKNFPTNTATQHYLLWLICRQPTQVSNTCVPRTPRHDTQPTVAMLSTCALKAGETFQGTQRGALVSNGAGKEGPLRGP